jgi:hypothetical protein
MPVTRQDLRNRFGFHSKSRDNNAGEHEVVRQGCYLLAEQLIEVVPDGRELALALTNLEQVMMWSNAGVARQDGQPDPTGGRKSTTTTLPGGRTMSDRELPEQ